MAKKRKKALKNATFKHGIIETNKLGGVRSHVLATTHPAVHPDKYAICNFFCLSIVLAAFLQQILTNF